MQSLINNHKPQLTIWHHPARFKVAACGRRFGKTYYAREKLSYHTRNKNSLYWYIAPTRDHAKDLLWEDLKERFDQLKWRHKKDEMSLSITRLKTRSTIRLRSAEKWDRLRGKGLWGAIFDEMADINIQAWTKAVRPALSDNRGWADFLGTPKGLNHFYEMFNEAKTRHNWASFQYKTIDSPFFQTEEGLTELRDAAEDLDERTYRQEYESSFETFGGRVCYAYDRLLHHTDQDYDENHPVYIGQDFNRTPMSSCMFQKIGGKSIQFGELSVNTSSTDEVCNIIKEKFPKWQNHGVFFRPDATGKRRTSNASRSDFEIIKGHGFGIDVGTSNPARIDRWQACNRAFEKDLVLINTKKCPKTVKELETIAYKEGTCEPNIKDPLVGHLFDAFGYNIYQDYPIIKTHKAKVRFYA
jgi:hypothetical protein